MTVGLAEEPTLFDAIDADPTFVQPSERFWGATGTRWSAYKGKREPCAVYVRLVHERGVQAVTRHLPASHKRIGPNDTIFVCTICASDLKGQDEQAEATAAARREAVAEQNRAKRAIARNRA